MLPPRQRFSASRGQGSEAAPAEALPSAPEATVSGFPLSPLRSAGSAALELALGLTLIWFLYRTAAGAFFVAEDFESLRSDWRSVGAELLHAGGLPGIRAGTVAFFALFAPLFGRDPEPYRLVLWPLFALCGLAVVRIGIGCRLTPPAALFAGIAFLAAPIHPEAVVWLASAAGTVPSSLLVLIAVAVWVREAVPSRGVVAICAVLFLLAMWTKETALALPPLLAVVDFARGEFPGLHPAKLWKRYGWTAGVLAFYLAWLAAIGELRPALGYGFEVTSRSSYYLSVWSAYAQDLLRPLAPAKAWALQPAKWSWATVAWPWLGAFLLLLSLRRLRWALLWVMAGLLPGLTKYGARLTFLAVAGIAFAAAIALQELALRLQRRVSARHQFAAGLAPFLVAVPLLLVADHRALEPQLANWVRAGEFARWLPVEVRRQVPAPPPGAEFFFAGLVDNFDGAAGLRMGIVPEVQRAYGDATLLSWIVRDGPARGPRRPLQSIPCEAATTRFFLRFDAAEARLLRQSAAEFGVRCP